MFKPLSLELAKINIWNVFSNGKISNDLCHEDASGFGLGAQPGGEVNRIAVDRVMEPALRPDVARDHLAGVDADPHAHLAPGDRVAVLSPNDPAFLTCYFAAAAAGLEPLDTHDVRIRFILIAARPALIVKPVRPCRADLVRQRLVSRDGSNREIKFQRAHADIAASLGESIGNVIDPDPENCWNIHPNHVHRHYAIFIAEEIERGDAREIVDGLAGSVSVAFQKQGSENDELARARQDTFGSCRRKSTRWPSDWA